jgi:hypothetical protein
VKAGSITPGDAAILALRELNSATRAFGPFNTPHEGWAVLLEEVDELWDEVKLKPSKRSVARMRKEAIQCAAMALRFVIDCCPE